ncbi:ROK family protein [Mangrovibacterium diazotrophicum]|uniref:Glucokinase n=1 Tax=Mangrovibacterium diazotrophicum TaxID=1261403 RepID=A0A419VYI4_9BACT|nr:ROK family protein [Mangrovibacterium diazotrophicum]RKD88276.1 glucokinase [Mangrovibacterium diazotrophicum]
MKNKQAILGIDMGGTSIKAGLITDGVIAEYKSVSTPASAPKEEVLEAVLNLIREFDLTGVAAIGIGVPTVVDVKAGIVYNATNIKSWDEVHLKDYLEERLKISTLVNNDANCFAVAEKYYGKAQGVENIVGIVMGTGLGVGLVINNKLFEGRNCGAGELGNLSYREHNFEYYCSGQFFQDEHNGRGEEFMKQAAAGDPAALEIFRELGFHIGQFLQAVLYAYDPECIVLGGSVTNAFPLFEEAMRTSLADGFLFPNSLKSLDIQCSELQHSGIYGAASLYNNQNS